MKLAIDMVDEVIKYSNSPFDHVVLVGSGDADFSPPIEKIIEKGSKKGLKFNFEIWSWRERLSGTLRRFSEESGKLMNYSDN